MSENDEAERGAALDRMTDAFFALDTDRRFTYLNERGRTMICAAIGEDLSVEELRGQKIWEAIPDAVDTPFYDHYEEALETQETVAFEAEYEPMDTWIAVRAYPSESGLSVYFRNVTERKERERRLERQASRFEDFGEILSHDLMNPLNVARSRVELARDSGDDDHLDEVETALKRIEAIVDDMSTAMTQGSLVDEVEAVDLAAAAESAWEAAPTGDATLEVEDEVRVRADEGALVRLLENLVHNAIEHGSSGRGSAAGDAADGAAGQELTVRVGIFEDGFYVADDGSGIPEDEREAVFEPGYSTKSDDAGLGLVSVRQIALAHGWEVEVCEGDAGGACFELVDVEVV